jgi:hypothetical protein
MRSPLGLVALLLASGALTAASLAPAGTASATSRIQTYCHAWAVGSPDSEHAKVRTAVSGFRGTPAAHGWLQVRVGKLNGGDSAIRRLWMTAAHAEVVWTMGRLKPGRYTGTFDYDSTPTTSRYQDCATGFSFQVART